MYIQEEYNAYIKAREALRKKIYSYLDNLHMRIHMELVLDRTEELLEVYEKLYNRGGI